MMFNYYSAIWCTPRNSRFNIDQIEDAGSPISRIQLCSTEFLTKGGLKTEFVVNFYSRWNNILKLS